MSPLFDPCRTKISPEPWNLAINSGRTEIEAGPDAETIAILTLDHDQVTNAGNARLIAAAPDLLAACERALDEMDGRPRGPGAIHQLRAAIAKAKGGDA